MTEIILSVFGRLWRQAHCAFSAALLAGGLVGGPALASDLSGTYEAYNVDGYNFPSKELAIKQLGVQSRVTIRFTSAGGNYPWKGRLVAAEGKAGTYLGRGSGGLLWELRDTGKSCDLQGEGLTAPMRIFEGVIFDDVRGISASGYAIAGQTPSGFRFIQMKAGSDPTRSPLCNFLELGRYFMRI